MIDAQLAVGIRDMTLDGGIQLYGLIALLSGDGCRYLGGNCAEVIEPERFVAVNYHRSFDDVFEFPDISGPIVCD